jgi:hypothetical protein
MVERIVACAQPENDDLLRPGEQIDWVAFVEASVDAVAATGFVVWPL